MVTDLSTNEDRWEWGVSVNVDLVVDVGLERSDKEGGVVIELVKMGNEAEEVCID